MVLVPIITHDSVKSNQILIRKLVSKLKYSVVCIQETGGIAALNVAMAPKGWLFILARA